MTMTWQDLIKFIRLLSKTSLTDRELTYVRRFSPKKIPWSSVFAIAEMEGVAGFSYINLKASGILEAIPTSIRNSLEKSGFSNAKNVCSKINWVLLEMSTADNGSCQDIEFLQQVMRSEGLILKMHLIKEEILFKHKFTEV